MNDQLRQRITDTIAKDRVMLFMKGSPSMPQCGFSAAVVGVLKEVGAKFGSYNILSDPELREGLKEYSSWPTYPQLYVDGKLVGGADIVRDLHARGELAKLIGA
ncbi:MAG TPA: Grx4 family monothiol glutaredoxin [Polyangia bacterium]|nr:Grx4 family monothiol glutaredoxin [Polyangia bacterium]